MKRLVNICAFCVIALCFHPWASTLSFAQTPESEIQANGKVPEKVLYEFYFRRVAYFEDLANKQGPDGHPKSPTYGHLKIPH